MSWFKKAQKNPPETIRVPSLRFLGEQRGPPEQVLKAKLSAFFGRDRSVNAAYLARIELGEGMPAGVALCLRTESGADKGVVEKIGAIFARDFNVQMHLDIIFLTPEQESALVKVCKPFFG